MTAVHLDLASTGRAGDAAYLAAADLAMISAELDVEYRLVGGNAVTLLCAARGVTGLVPGRETTDADFGADYQVVGDGRVLTALLARGYAQVEGNRFRRQDEGRDLVVDVLAPAFGSRLVPNQAHGDLVLDEVPGLALALARPGVEIDLGVILTDGTEVRFTTVVPDVVSMLCLKAYAYEGRWSDRDAVDIWRLLEAAFAAGVRAADWPSGASATEAAATLWQHFGRPSARGPAKATAAMAGQTRIRALVMSIVGARP